MRWNNGKPQQERVPGVRLQLPVFAGPSFPLPEKYNLAIDFWKLTDFDHVSLI